MESAEERGLQRYSKRQSHRSAVEPVVPRAREACRPCQHDPTDTIPESRRRMAWRGRARLGLAGQGGAWQGKGGTAWKLAVAAFSSQRNPTIASVAATSALLPRVRPIHRRRIDEAVRGDWRAGGVGFPLHATGPTGPTRLSGGRGGGGRFAHGFRDPRQTREEVDDRNLTKWGIHPDMSRGGGG